MKRTSANAGLLLLLALSPGCSTSESPSVFGDSGADSATGMRDGPSDVAMTHDVVGLTDVVVTSDGTTGLLCSADLHSVVNKMGTIVKECPSDEGCLGGLCVPACDAAAASKGTIGCDFVVATPSFYPSSGTPCFAVFLANGWTKAATIQVSRAGATYDPTTFGLIPIASMPTESWSNIPATGVPTGNVGILFLRDVGSVRGVS
jgi:hypothetical protein